MNILNKFTIKSLKLNKKRTIVTIIGIILSTALICCVAGMFTSFDKTMINSIINQQGDYHVILYDVDKDDVDSIKNNKKVSKIYLEKSIGYYVDDTFGYLNLVANDEDELERYKLFKGRIPENSNELLVNYNMRNLLGKEIELIVIPNDIDEIYNNIDENINLEEIDFETLEKIITPTKYTVVGVQDSSYWSNTSIIKLDNDYKKIDVKIRYKNIRDTYKISKTEYSDYGKSYNKDLLDWNFVTESKNYMKTFIYLVGIILGIIVVSSVFVIRNSFEISITEKMKQFGMLSSIGATKHQIRKAVLFEGLILGLIGIPLGIFLGYIVIHILILFSNVMLGGIISDEVKFVVSVPLFAIILSVALGMVTIILSALKSAYKAGKISPIEAIRSNSEIKLKNKKLRTPKIINKLFGIGGVVAYKNLKRSKKKYRTTVISLVVSITIFISLYSFMDTLFGASKILYRNMHFNLEVQNKYTITNVNSYEESIDTYKKEEIIARQNIDNILKLDGIEDYMILRSYLIDLKDYGLINLTSVGDNTYNKILKDINMKYDDTKDGIIYVENLYARSGNKIIKRFDFNKNDLLHFQDGDYELDLKVVNINKLEKYDLQNLHSGDGMFIISDELFDKISNEKGRSGIDLLIKTKNADNLEKQINEMNIDNIEVNNISQAVKYINNIVLWISVFLYGFIIVISLIGVTNIFNTITTNMNLRSKEFAMLKSVGMTTKEFNRMIRLESIMYGFKSLFYGIVLGSALSLLIYKALSTSIDMGYHFPFTAIIISIIFITLVVGLIMKYSLSKINKQNIIETIRQDNI